MTEEKRLTAVTMILTTTIFNESLDELKDSVFYKRELKFAGNQFETQITKFCNRYVDDFWDADEKASSDLTQSIRNIAKHLASLKPSEIMTFEEQLKKENENRN